MSDICILLLTFFISIVTFCSSKTLSPMLIFLSRRDIVFSKFMDDVLKALFDLSKNITVSASIILAVPILIKSYRFPLRSWTVFGVVVLGTFMFCLAIVSFFLRLYVGSGCNEINNVYARIFIFLAALTFVVLGASILGYMLSTEIQDALSSHTGCLNINTVVYCPAG